MIEKNTTIAYTKLNNTRSVSENTIKTGISTHDTAGCCGSILVLSGEIPNDTCCGSNVLDEEKGESESCLSGSINKFKFSDSDCCGSNTLDGEVRRREVHANHEKYEEESLSILSTDRTTVDCCGSKLSGGGGEGTKCDRGGVIMLEVDGKSEESPLDGLANTLKKREPKWRLSNEKIGPSKDRDHKVSNIWLKDTTGARWFKRICDEGLILKQNFNMFEDKGRSKEDRDFLNGSAIE